MCDNIVLFLCTNDLYSARCTTRLQGGSAEAGGSADHPFSLSYIYAKVGNRINYNSYFTLTLPIYKCSNNDFLRLITVILDLSGLLNRPERSEGYLRPEGPISL